MKNVDKFTHVNFCHNKYFFSTYLVDLDGRFLGREINKN